MANKITKKVIKDLKDRQEYAFDIVYLKYHKLVYSIIYEIVYDKELSKDLSQDTFIKMLDNIYKCDFVDENRFRGWLCSIARNNALDELRHKEHQNELMDEETVDLIKDRQDDFVKKASVYFPQLTIDEIKLLNLYYNCHMSYSEIADFLDSNKAFIYREIKRIIAKIDL